MVVYRILKMDRAVAGLSSTLASTGSPDGTYRQPKTRMRLQKVMQIIIESALIYTLASALAFVTIVKYESNAQYITTAVASHLIFSINRMLMINRISLS